MNERTSLPPDILTLIHRLTVALTIVSHPSETPQLWRLCNFLVHSLLTLPVFVTFIALSPFLILYPTIERSEVDVLFYFQDEEVNSLQFRERLSHARVHYNCVAIFPLPHHQM